MGEARRILSVSYGAFSCTLEGYEDPLPRLMQVAEYFRELAARQPGFGAVPPPADAASGGAAAMPPPAPARTAAAPGATVRGRLLRNRRILAQARAAAALPCGEARGRWRRRRPTDWELMPRPEPPPELRPEPRPAAPAQPATMAIRAGGSGGAAPSFAGAPRLVRARLTRRSPAGAEPVPLSTQHGSGTGQEPPPLTPAGRAPPHRTRPGPAAVSVQRLLQETDSQFHDDEAVRRRATIAQLKAAVAVVRAEGMAPAAEARARSILPGAVAETPYREDLRQAVGRGAMPRPQQDQDCPAAAARERPPPLRLDGAQRVDAAVAAGAEAPQGPERSRR